ncbi:hypothetical protein OSB04_016556 [Centaurea solstitialis]|uniref:Uncharacterized protein n=1 Tax=Centaurea solstitialis TaxID=347529 RepID=A0AA38TEF0_9ASTR|nr:hypothetical protein OSB04_016556 [Centaurea solstitialis]
MAKLLVEECRGHLLAIIILARSLRGVIDVGVWKLTLQELASQQEPSSSELCVVSDVMVRVLRCICSRMETLSQNCIIQFALHYVGTEVEKSSLIDVWIGDGLVKGAQEGEHAFKGLISSFLLEPVGETCVRMRDETRVTLVAYIVPRAYGLYLKRDGLESNRMPNVEEWNAREIYLSNNIVSELPDSPNCPILVDLLLNSNKDLMDIPITFFDHMPTLQVLNLSGTSIKHLPSSILKLISLRQLIIRDCDLLMELPPEIGALRNLKLFDSEGTQLIYLPDQFGSLTKLECLKFSLYNHADRYKQSKKLMQIIPATSLSKLVRLKELSICVDSYVEWWEDEAKLIIDVLSNLRNLEYLKMYFPTTGSLRKFMEQQNLEGVSIYSHLSNFSFTVGHLQQRVISCLPLDLDKMFVKLPKCLKYTNGEGDTEVIAMALIHAHALLLDRHWSIPSLSTFGAAEMRGIRFFLLSECNEMLEIFNGREHLFMLPVLGSLEYLAIHHMKSLSCIWKGPIHSGSLVNLETLVMKGCPELRTILTEGLLDNLTSLQYLMVEDCTNVNSIIVSSGSCHPTSTQFLPRLKKMSLLQLPELVSISDGIISIARRLESLVVYDCPSLEKLSFMEVCDGIKEIKGENEWWDALKWCEPEWSSGRPDYLANVFNPLGTDDDIMDELADAINILPQLSD